MERRGLLAALGSVGASAVAGCTDGLLGGGSDDGGGESTEDLPAVATWAPEPAVYDQEGYALVSVGAADLHADADHLHPRVLEQLTELPESMPGFASPGDVERIHFVGPQANVVTGGVDREAARSFYEDRAFEEQGTHAGYAVLTGNVGMIVPRRAVGIGDDAIVVVAPQSSDDDSDLRPILEAVLDARAGDRRRYAASDQNLNRLLADLGEGDVLTARSHGPDQTIVGAVAEGLSTTVEGAETHLRGTVVFAPDRRDASAVEEWANRASVFEGSSPETTTDGRIVRTTGTVQTDRLAELPDEFPGPTSTAEERPSPTVRWDFDYEPRGERRGLLTVMHEGGDDVPASELFLRGGPFADVEGADRTTPGPWTGTTMGDEEWVTAADQIVLGVRPSFEIEVVWQPDDDQPPETLARETGPEY